MRCLQRVQIDLHEVVAAKVDIVVIVLPRADPERDGQPEQGAADAQLAALEVNLPVVLDDSHRVHFRVVD